MRTSRLLLVATLAGATALAAAACGSLFDAGGCTAQFVYGLRVDVLDSLTRAPTGRIATVVAREGAFADTARSPVPPRFESEVQTLFLAGERPGTYDVTVARTGYRPWRQSAVRVTRGACHVNPVQLTALLQRLP